jgi:hypothetical protein
MPTIMSEGPELFCSTTPPQGVLPCVTYVFNSETLSALWARMMGGQSLQGVPTAQADLEVMKQ